MTSRFFMQYILIATMLFASGASVLHEVSHLDSSNDGSEYSLIYSADMAGHVGHNHMVDHQLPDKPQGLEDVCEECLHFASAHAIVENTDSYSSTLLALAPARFLQSKNLNKRATSAYLSRAPPRLA